MSKVAFGVPFQLEDDPLQSFEVVDALKRSQPDCPEDGDESFRACPVESGFHASQSTFCRSHVLQHLLEQRNLLDLPWAPDPCQIAQ